MFCVLWGKMHFKVEWQPVSTILVKRLCCWRKGETIPCMLLLQQEKEKNCTFLPLSYFLAAKEFFTRTNWQKGLQHCYAQLWENFVPESSAS